MNYICINCDIEFNSYNKGAKFCSKSCLAKKVWTGRKHTEKTKRKMRKSEIWKGLDKAINFYQSGKTCKEIADLNNLNKNTLKTIFRKIGLKMRKTGSRMGVKVWNTGKPYYAIRGKKNWRWKGGITILNQQIRHCVEYKNWIKKVMNRDNYICQECKEKKREIEAHHCLKSFSEILKDNNIKSYQDAQKCDELWNISNGKTLCLKCHDKTKKFSKQQMQTRS